MAFCGGWCTSSGVGERERERELLIAESAERESVRCLPRGRKTEARGQGPGARGQGCRAREEAQAQLVITLVLSY